jgi:hypothetical protein
MVRPADEDFQDEGTSYMALDIYPRMTSDVIHEVLGPDVEMAVWNGAVLPYDAVYERRISAANTQSWWADFHRNNTDYHTRFRGYCPRCQQGG